jgi:hypothetical protein
VRPELPSVTAVEYIFPFLRRFFLERVHVVRYFEQVPALSAPVYYFI